jgi:hypothetical protein
MARLTSDFYVAHLMRRVASEGGFAAIIKRGASEAGAVYIALRQRSGAMTLYGPAPQQAYQDDHPVDRFFYLRDTVSNDADISTFVEAETRFDRDFWLVELDIDTEQKSLPFEIMKL